MRTSGIIFVFSILAALLMSANNAFAAELEGGTVSSGGKVDLQGSGYNLHDLKGQPAVGEVSSTVSGITTTVEVGGIYGIIEFPLPGKGHVTGEVTAYDPAGPGLALSGALITVYTAAETIKTGYTDATGNYQILNINPTPPPPATTYYIECSADGYFSYQTTLTITADQTVTQNFQLVAGQTAPEGTVWLNITREGSSVALTWPIGTLGGQVPSPGSNLDLYILRSDTANGIFQAEFKKAAQATTPWIKILENGALTPYALVPANNFSLAPTGTKLFHNNQVGKLPADGGVPEVYYKAILGTNDLDDTGMPAANAAIFLSAEAVGKTDFLLKAGNENLVSIPLKQVNNNPNAVFGGDFSAGDVIKHYDNSGQGSWPQSAFTGSNWDSGITEVNESKGYWFNVTPEKTLTILGRVKDDSQLYSIKKGNENLLGSPFSTLLQVTNPTGADLLGLGSAIGADVIVKIYDNSGQGSWPEAKYTQASARWNQGLPTLKSGRGFWVNSLSGDDAPHTWILSVP